MLLQIRQNLVDQEEELASTKKKLSEIIAELTTTKRELVTVKSDCRNTFMLSIVLLLLFELTRRFVPSFSELSWKRQTGGTGGTQEDVFSRAHRIEGRA